MGKTKRQHYVPQSYLRRFSTDGKQISVYDKVLKKGFSDGIRNVAQETGFNEVVKETGATGTLTEEDKMIVETAFSGIEGRFSTVVSEIMALQPGARITPEQRQQMATFTAIQLLRTRAHRNVINEAVRKFVLALCEEAVKINFGEDHLKYLPKVLYEDKAAGRLQSLQIFDFKKLAQVAASLNKHLWMIGINDTGHPFYTSDNPVVMHTPFKKQLVGVGIESLGIEIAFPLSSSRVLLLADRLFYDGASDGMSVQMAADNVEYYNSLQVIHSERQIYCEKQDFDLVEDMIAENPALATPQSDRVDVRFIDVLDADPNDEEKSNEAGAS
jgi:hypothetical protein